MMLYYSLPEDCTRSTMALYLFHERFVYLRCIDASCRYHDGFPITFPTACICKKRISFIFSSLIPLYIEENNSIIGSFSCVSTSKLHIPAKQHNRPEGTACYSASNCTL